MVGQRPAHFGLARGGWWLAGIRQAVSWLAGRCLATVFRAVRRGHLAYKRGRRHVHSPDPAYAAYAAYAAKLATVAYVRARAARELEGIVALYEDELTYYRRPTVAGGYAPVGGDGPRAAQGWARNRSRRVAACLDPRAGRLVAWQRERFDWRTLRRFYLEAVLPAYPDARRIYLIQDNWPVHFPPALLAALADTPLRPLRPLRLPTYAPWTNPVEKVWRRLYAEVLHLHLHRRADAWDELTQTVQAWLDQWAEPPADDLLRYVGLLCPH